MNTEPVPRPGFTFTAKHWLMVGFVGVVALYIFFPEEQIIVPQWGTFALFGWISSISLWLSLVVLERSGRVITTPLGTGMGSCEGLHPNDIRMTPFDPNKPSWGIAAQGGFSASGFEMTGKKRFLVFLAAFCQETNGVVSVHANFKPVKYEELFPEIQHELNQLKGFNTVTAEKKNNIYFSMTSDYFSKASSEDLDLESMFKLSALHVNKLQAQLHNAYDEVKRQQSKGTSWSPMPDYVEVREND